MSIETTLAALQGDITAARAAVTAKGGTVTSGGGSSHLATDIGTIPIGEPTLPDGYMRLLALQCGGQAYIATDIPFDNDWELQTRCTPLPSPERYTHAWGITGTFWQYKASDGTASYTYWGGVDMKSSGHTEGDTYFCKDGLCEYIASRRVLVYNATGGVARTDNLQIMARANVYVLIGEFYYLKIKKGQRIVHWFLPALRLEDTELGLIDVVTGKFYTNAGTGEFTGVEM